MTKKIKLKASRIVKILLFPINLSFIYFVTLNFKKNSINLPKYDFYVPLKIHNSSTPIPGTVPTLSIKNQILLKFNSIPLTSLLHSIVM